MLRENGPFTLHSVTRENLSTLKKALSADAEARICELADMASEIADTLVSLIDEGMTHYEALALLSDELVLEDTDEPIDPSINGERLLTYQKHLTSTDRVFFSDLLCEMLAERGIFLTEADFLPIGEPIERFAFIKNPLADEAYDVFSEEFGDPRLCYASSFSEAVRLLKNGEVGYCLLPLEEEGGVRISAVESLIYKNDLKIGAVTPVFGFDGEAKLRYARVADVMRKPSFTGEDDRYFEIRLEKNTEILLGEILMAADAFGILTHRIGTVTWEDTIGYHSVVFKTSGASFHKLMLYLTLFAPDFCVTGLYKNAE